MERERFDIEIITEARRKSIEKSIAAADVETLKTLGEKLFPFHDHPWREKFLGFLAEHPGASYFRATTHDQVEIVYCSTRDKGIWYIPGQGVGPLGPRGCAILKDIVAHSRGT